MPTESDFLIKSMPLCLRIKQLYKSMIEASHALLQAATFSSWAKSNPTFPNQGSGLQFDFRLKFCSLQHIQSRTNLRAYLLCSSHEAYDLIMLPGGSGDKGFANTHAHENWTFKSFNQTLAETGFKVVMYMHFQRRCSADSNPVYLL